jgi:hypothetical protein
MKVLAGARGERREQAGGIAIEREGDDAERDPRDHADARREPVHAIDQVDHVDHSDDADHGDHVAEIDRAPARKADQLHRTGVHLAEEGEGEARHGDPGGDRDDDRHSLPEQLRCRVQLEDVVEGADGGDHHRAGQDRPGLIAPGQPDQPGHQGSGQDREPAQLRRRRLVEGAPAGQVDRPRSARQADRRGDEQQGDEARDQEGEDCFDASRHIDRTRV